MSSNKYNEKIIRWSNEPEGYKYILYNNLLEYLGNNLYVDYEPMKGPHPDYTSRLESWLENIEDEKSQKLMLELATKIFYVGNEEFISLYRTAFNSIAKKWLINKLNIDFDNINYNEKLIEAIESTWFCPVTDSFRINQFFKVNQVETTNSYRPDWRSLKQFSDKEQVKKYISEKGIKYIVLLEDFVGSGTQVVNCLKFAAQLDDSVEILFIPLILCPKGLEHINKTLKDFKNFTLWPTICLKEEDLINHKTKHIPTYQPFAQLVLDTFSKVKGSLNTEEIKKLKEFGFKNTGGLTVMFTNTPNNSLPMIHIQSDSWKALFHRYSRD